MSSRNAAIFITAQFGSRFANSFLTTAVRFELLEIGGVAKFASAQVANQVARVFMQQVSGVLTDNYPLKKLYVIGEALNLLLVFALVPALLGHDITLPLFLVNVGLGLTQAFSQPVSKSLPPLVVSEADLAIVNSWDLTSDKIGRNIAPMAFAVASSSLGFHAALIFSFALYVALIGLKQILTVTEQPTQKKSHGDVTISNRFLAIFRQIWDGLLSLKSDRTIGLLIMNTLATNMLIYPLSTLVFPVIFRGIPEGAIETENSLASKAILFLQEALGIKKKKVWMNYVALVSMGGVVGPVFSNVVVYLIKYFASKHPEKTNWIGLNFGIVGQFLTMCPLLVVLLSIQHLSAGASVFLMFIIWGAMSSMNNVTTIYFNAHSQHRLGRSERGRFIANILTLFTLANTVGSTLYGFALSSDNPHAQIVAAVRIAGIAMVIRGIVITILWSDGAGRQTVMLKKDT
eukprot:TRINITY_DN21434_c0_g2_i1.p1 TRINITY_DN21434_c0_g2~~TRINITY_DN21434_c0_g2_i1.p1  ORF type:complete len:460 (-),score=59.46 TRINITY_DN21434_c0_g2_i1:78-1457(-)